MAAIVLPPEEFLMPFLFVLVDVFGVLQLARVFNKSVSFLIALVLAFFAANNPVFISLFWSQIINVVIFFIALFFLAFTLQLFGLRGKGAPKAKEGLVIYGAILFVLLSIGFNYTETFPTLPVIGGGENLMLLVSIILILAVFWAALKASEEKRPPPKR